MEEAGLFDYIECIPVIVNNSESKLGNKVKGLLIVYKAKELTYHREYP